MDATVLDNQGVRRGVSSSVRWTSPKRVAVALVLLSAACGRAAEQAGPAASASSAPTYSGRIAFVSDRVEGSGYNLEIFSMDADGNGQTRLTENPGHDHQPSWSPDGSEIVFATGEANSEMTTIMLMKADSSAVRTITEGWVRVAVPRWSPDGDEIAVSGDRGDGTQVYLVEVETGEITRITDEPDLTGVGGAYQPDWSPDGQSIIHTRIRFDDDGSRTSQLYVMDADGSNVSVLDTGAVTDSEPRWSPDGSRIAFVTGRHGATEIYVMDVDDGKLTRVTDHPGDDFTPTWSPDGTRVAFSSSRDGDAEIYIVKTDGSELTRLTDNSRDNTNPDWAGARADKEAAPGQTNGHATKYVGFYPPSRIEDGMTIMPLTFVDGSVAEVVAPRDLGVHDMSAAIYTSGGLGGIDRTMDFRYKNGSSFMYAGPLKTYEGVDGSTVELWHPIPETPYECPNLVFRFDDWYVGVRACQDHLSDSEKTQWARLLQGDISHEGFPVLTATPPLQLQETGGHMGPQMYLGMDRANWVQLIPGTCDPERYANDGEIQVMPDGTRVSFNRLGGNNNFEYDWFVSWCEDGLMGIQVEYAYERFARGAAEGFRLRNIVLAD